MSFASKPKIVVAGWAAFAMLAPYKIPTELSEKPAYFTRCAAEHRPCPQTSSCLLINRSMNYFRSMTGTRVCCVTCKLNLVPRAFSSTIFKMIRHFENRRGEGPGDEVAGYKWVINCPAERENEVLPRQRVYVYFSFQKQILFTIISTLSKNKQKSMGEVNTIFGRENFPSKL